MASVKKAGGFLLGLEHANLLQGAWPPQEAPPLAGLSYISLTIYPALRTGPCLATLGGGALIVVRAARVCAAALQGAALVVGTEKGRCPSLRSPRDIFAVWNLLVLAASAEVLARRGCGVAKQGNARRAATPDGRA